MNARAIVLGALASLVLAGCGSVDTSSYGEPFRLPVGETTWDPTQPSWYHEGVLHVGERTVRLDGADQYRLGATGVYWMKRGMLLFTGVDGRTQDVADVGWGNLAASADRSVFATVDQSRGPKDRYGTRVIQVAAFDTRTGEQLYRTPDEEPDKRDDLADLYGEIMPLLKGVSNERLFFYGETIDLADGSATPTGTDADGIEVYDGFADTVFPDGYHVGLRGQGERRTLNESSMFAVGRMSPDRSILFDVSQWPTAAVAYDAATGRQRPIDAPWDHFTLVGFSDADTFFGTAERIDEDNIENVLRERQVVTCEVDTLVCTPVSPVIPTQRVLADDSPYFLVEGDSPQP